METVVSLAIEDVGVRGASDWARGSLGVLVRAMPDNPGQGWLVIDLSGPNAARLELSLSTEQADALAHFFAALPAINGRRWVW